MKEGKQQLRRFYLLDAGFVEDGTPMDHELVCDFSISPSLISPQVWSTTPALRTRLTLNSLRLRKTWRGSQRWVFLQLDDLI